MSDESIRSVLDDYAACADACLVRRYDALEPERIYACVLDLLPPAGARVADIGAGTGRDAAWLAKRGCRLLAVEPVRQLREAGRALHRSVAIDWLDDRLPDLTATRALGPFDAVLLCAVWHHLDESDRARAMPNLAAATAKGGTFILSLRHETGQAFPAPPEASIDAAQACGFRLIRRCEAESVSQESRALGVRWTWLAFAKV